jgi:uncharacterized SAM-binding protein YcdF (DUF218 family)
VDRGLWTVDRFKKFLKYFLYFHLFLGVAILLTHCSVTRYAKRSFEEARKEVPFDAIIVPGVPYDTAKDNRIMVMRVYWAKLLYDSGFARNIIFSGAAVYSPYVEGIVMKLMADSLGIPPDHTFSETRAEHSTENIYYSWKLAREKGFTHLAVASDPYQSSLLGSFTRRYCPGTKTIPIIFGTMGIDTLTLPRIDASSAYRKDFVSIVKRESFWLRFRETLGKRVKEEHAAEERAARAARKENDEGQ